MDCLTRCRYPLFNGLINSAELRPLVASSSRGSGSGSRAHSVQAAEMARMQEELRQRKEYEKQQEEFQRQQMEYQRQSQQYYLDIIAQQQQTIQVGVDVS